MIKSIWSWNYSGFFGSCRPLRYFAIRPWTLGMASNLLSPPGRFEGVHRKKPPYAICLVGFRTRRNASGMFVSGLTLRGDYRITRIIAYGAGCAYCSQVHRKIRRCPEIQMRLLSPPLSVRRRFDPISALSLNGMAGLC